MSRSLLDADTRRSLEDKLHSVLKRVMPKLHELEWAILERKPKALFSANCPKRDAKNKLPYFCVYQHMAAILSHSLRAKDMNSLNQKIDGLREKITKYFKEYYVPRAMDPLNGFYVEDKKIFIPDITLIRGFILPTKAKGHTQLEIFIYPDLKTYKRYLPIPDDHGYHNLSIPIKSIKDAL
jgi:hypothetical protein